LKKLKANGNEKLHKDNMKIIYAIILMNTLMIRACSDHDHGSDCKDKDDKECLNDQTVIEGEDMMDD